MMKIIDCEAKVLGFKSYWGLLASWSGVSYLSSVPQFPYLPNEDNNTYLK
jgi:hypothetical protein